MKTPKIIMWGLIMLIVTMFVIPSRMQAQDFGDATQPERFIKEELFQMLAPIALYPDSLVAQILMASTYPLEVVEAERWLRHKRHLKGDELNNAMQEKTWDPSIKLLCHFPDVLLAMSDKLDQTRKLGDAFLSQQDDVMAVIQELRHRAMDHGTLKTIREQQVIIEREIIRIEPVDPVVVYVPVYDPFYAYGPWWYPAYPPYYWYYPPGVVVSHGFISFGHPYIIGIGLFSWAWFDWHVHHIYIDIHKARRFHRCRDWCDVDRHIWIHEPSHRKGVAYRDRKTSEYFGVKPPRMSAPAPETRGYPSIRMEKEAKRPSTPVQHKEVIRPPEKAEQKSIQSTPSRDNPFQGLDRGNFERKASERGQYSSQGTDIRRQTDTQVRSVGKSGGKISGDAGRQEDKAFDKGKSPGSGSDDQRWNR
jgi:hypothetical protein